MNIQELDKVELILCQFLNETKDLDNHEHYINVSKTLQLISKRKSLINSYEKEIKKDFLESL